MTDGQISALIDHQAALQTQVEQLDRALAGLVLGVLALAVLVSLLSWRVHNQ